MSKQFLKYLRVISIHFDLLDVQYWGMLNVQQKWDVKKWDCCEQVMQR